MALYEQDPSSENCCQRCNYYYCLTFGVILLVLSLTFIGVSTTGYGLDAFVYAGSVVLLVAGIFTWCGAGVVLFQYRLLQNRYRCCRFLFYFCYGCCLDDKDKRNCQKDMKCCFTCCRKCRHCCCCCCSRGSNEEDEEVERHGDRRRADDRSHARRSHRQDNGEEEIITIGDETDADRYRYRGGGIYIFSEVDNGAGQSHRSGQNSRTRGVEVEVILSRTSDGQGMRPGTSLHSVLSLPPAYEDPDPNPPPYTDEPPPAYTGEPGSSV